MQCQNNFFRSKILKVNKYDQKYVEKNTDFPKNTKKYKQKRNNGKTI